MFPAAFGRAPRNFYLHCHEFSGEEWKQQATLFLPVYLHNELPGIHSNAFCNLVETIGKSLARIFLDVDRPLLCLS